MLVSLMRFLHVFIVVAVINGVGTFKPTASG